MSCSVMNVTYLLTQGTYISHYNVSLIVLLPHLLLKQLCNCKCAYTMYLYVASVLVYFNIIHGFMEGVRFECFNMWDYKLNIRMFSLWGGGGGDKENMCQLVGTSMGVFFSFKC